MPEPKIVLHCPGATTRRREFRLTMWELKDLTAAVSRSRQSGHIDPDEHERLFELETKLMDMIREALLSNREAHVDFRLSMDVQ